MSKHPEVDLDAIEARATAATPGPWKPDTEVRGDCVVYGPNGRFLMNMQAEPHWLEYPGEKRAVSFDVDARDAEFIAHARGDIPALLALVREQAAKLDELRALADVADINDQQFGDGNGGSLTTEAIRAALTTTEPDK